MLGTLMLAVLTVGQKPSCCGPSMSAFAADPAFIAAHLAPLPLRFKPQEGKTVRFEDANGQGTNGFYVAPRPGAKADIVMVHEWWGLNDFIKREAERLHDATGYGILAVDLYGGKVAATPQEAGQYMKSVDDAQASAIVRGAVAALKNGALGPRAPKVGTIGWCFGGGWSLQTAIQGGPDVNACVMYYGMPDDEPAHLAQLRAPVLLLWGERDKWINAKVVSDFEAAMKRANLPLQTKGYDADHAFANPSNPNYNRADAQDAWQRTIAFYRRTLG